MSQTNEEDEVVDTYVITQEQKITKHNTCDFVDATFLIFTFYSTLEGGNEGLKRCCEFMERLFSLVKINTHIKYMKRSNK